MSQKGVIYTGDKPLTKKIVVEDKTHEKIQKETQKLEKLVADSDEVIYEATATFPFQLFPDKIIVDKNKVTVVRKEFLFKRSFPILIEDLRTVRVNRGLLFSSIEMEIMGFDQNPSPITHLSPVVATKVKQYLLGLMEAKRTGIDLSVLSAREVKNCISKIGTSDEETNSLM